MLYVRTFYGVRRLLFERLKRFPNHLKPMLGGLATGAVGFFLPEALGTGYGVLQTCFQSDVGSPPDLSHTLSASTMAGLLPESAGPLWTAAIVLAVIAFAKILTTGFSIGSGGSGGVFGPAVAIGGALGAACGLACVKLFPALPIAPGAFALVGMAGFFAGAANTPVSTIIMVSEMTGNYNLLVPSMMVCMIAFVLCRRFILYDQQLASRLEAPSKAGGMATAILRRLTVDEALRIKGGEGIVVVQGDTSLSEIMEHYAHSTQSCFPVVDKEGRTTGIIDAADLRRVITETSMGDLIIARDIEVTPVRSTRDDSLLAAVNAMVRFDRNEVVVVDKKDPNHILGTLARGDIIAAYNRQLIEASSAVPI
jgi:CIC family chloride channel protein